MFKRDGKILPGLFDPTHVTVIGRRPIRLRGDRQPGEVFRGKYRRFQQRTGR
jgi:hypothetical protein